MTNKLKELCLEITDKCPLECIHCSSNSSPQASEELNFGLIKKILDNFKELGGKILEISGGEPLLHKDLNRIMNYAKNKGLKVYLYTSGLNENITELKADRFLLALHGSNAETHQKITGKNNFSKIMNIIKNLKKENKYVGIHFVPLKINYREIEGLCRVAANLSINELAVLRFVPQGRGEKNKDLLALNKEEARQLLSTIKNLKYKFLRIGCPMDFQSRLNCKAGKNTLSIKPNGDVVICPAFKYKKILGNLKKDNLKNIWENSPILNKIREKSGINKCLAQSFYSGGKDPWCEIAKEVYEK